VAPDGVEGRDIDADELSTEAGVMEPTTFTALKAMERLGYIRRKQVAGNRKNVYVFLTAKGRALKTRLVPVAEEVNRIAVAGMAREEVARTRAHLITIIENLARDEAQRK